MLPKVYYDIMSQPCRALYIFLKCTGIQFEQKEIALRKGENKRPEYLKLNMFGKVPTIDDKGFVLTESVAILKYLSDKYGAPDHWYPKDLQQRAKIDEYCAWQHLNTRMKSAKVFVNEVIMPGALGDMEPLVDDMNQMLDEFEKMFLKEKKFINGDKVSIADLLAVCEILQPISSGRDVTAGRPKLESYIESVKEQTNPYFDQCHAILYRLRERNLKKNKL